MLSRLFFLKKKKNRVLGKGVNIPTQNRNFSLSNFRLKKTVAVENFRDPNETSKKLNKSSAVSIFFYSLAIVFRVYVEIEKLRNNNIIYL